jgi:hypothetical protein
VAHCVFPARFPVISKRHVDCSAFGAMGGSTSNRPSWLPGFGVLSLLFAVPIVAVLVDRSLIILLGILSYCVIPVVCVLAPLAIAALAPQTVERVVAIALASVPMLALLIVHSIESIQIHGLFGPQILTGLWATASCAYLCVLCALLWRRAHKQSRSPAR